MKAMYAKNTLPTDERRALSRFENEGGLAEPVPGRGEVPPSEPVPKGYRRLEWNELVSAGDFVAGKDGGVEPWEGPPGFRAGSFVKTIYRRNRSRSTPASKTRESV
jgi:hypothetical protein